MDDSIDPLDAIKDLFYRLRLRFDWEEPVLIPNNMDWSYVFKFVILIN